MPPIANKTLQSHINQSTGKVPVYDQERSRWLQLAPVDAREQLDLDIVRLNEPLVDMDGPGGPVRVKHSKVKAMIDKQYTVVSIVDPAYVEQESAETPDAEESVVDFSQYTVAQLRGMAEAANVAIPNGSNKDSIIVQLQEIKYVPTDINEED